MSGGSPTRRAASDGALTAAALLATMGLGAALAALVLVLFGSTAQTDAFFAAYGLYAFLGAAAQAMRVSLPARLPAGEGWAPVDRHLSGVLVVAGVAALPLVVLGGPLAAALVGGLGAEAVATSRFSLAVLWLAGSLQLLSGLLAAALGARGRYGPAAAGYVAGAFLSLSVVVLGSTLGVRVVPTAVAAGSLLTTVLLGRVLLAAGWRPRGTSGARAAARVVALGAAGPVVLQAGYVLSTAVAARHGAGAVTGYTYAFFAVLLVLGVTAGPASIVLAAGVAERWDRTSAGLAPTERAVRRAGLLLSTPLLALGVLAGDDVLDAVRGGSAGAAPFGTVVLSLSVLVAAQVVGTVPLLAAYAAGRYRHVAGVSVAALVVQAVALAVVAVATDRLVWLGVAASIGAAVSAGGLLVAVHGSRAGRPALEAALDVVVLAALAGLGYGAGVVLVASLPDGLGAAVLAWSTGTLVLAVASRALLPGWWEPLRRLARRI